MNAAVGLTAGLGLDGDRCIRVIPRQKYWLYCQFCIPKYWQFPSSFVSKFEIGLDISGYTSDCSAKTKSAILEFFLNGAELLLNSVEFSEFREFDKSLKHELG